MLKIHKIDFNQIRKGKPYSQQPGRQIGVGTGKIVIKDIEQTVKNILLGIFEQNTYQVGGSVRDSFLGKESKDYDFLITNHSYEDIITQLAKFGKVDLVGKSFGVIKFRPNGLDDFVDIAIPRKEQSTGVGHRDFSVETQNIALEDDLIRRDFTINALAKNLATGKVIDLFGGLQDLNSKTIRVIRPEAFEEDPLRMVRAVRFAAQLGFKIDENTQKLIKNDANLVSSLSLERVSEELIKVLVSNNPSYGINILRELGLLKFLLPEVEKLSGVTQPSAYHIYDVYDHTMSAVENISNKLELRLAALLHDIAKPETRTDLGEIHFYGHEDAGEPKAREILTRLKFPNETIEKVTKLIRYHLVDLDMSNKGLRRLISKVGVDNIYDLLELKRADKLASKPDRTDLWKLDQMKERVAEQLSGIGAFSIKDLAVGGQDIMRIFNIPPSPKVGQILRKLFDAVLENPELNNPEDLIKLALLESREVAE